MRLEIECAWKSSGTLCLACTDILSCSPTDHPRKRLLFLDRKVGCVTWVRCVANWLKLWQLARTLNSCNWRWIAQVRHDVDWIPNLPVQTWKSNSSSCHDTQTGGWLLSWSHSSQCKTLSTPWLKMQIWWHGGHRGNRFTHIYAFFSGHNCLQCFVHSFRRAGLSLICMQGYAQNAPVELLSFVFSLTVASRQHIDSGWLGVAVSSVPMLPVCLLRSKTGSVTRLRICDKASKRCKNWLVIAGEANPAATAVVLPSWQVRVHSLDRPWRSKSAYAM